MTNQNIEAIVLPEIKERKGFLVYLKIILAPCLIFALAVAAFLGHIDFKIELLTLILMGLILLVALLFARHNAEFASSFLEAQKDDFKKALKNYIIRNFLKIGKETKSNASFDDFAKSFVKDARNENFAAIAPTTFATLGILGTFLSIALFVPDFNTADLAALEWEISLFLSGIANAFYIAVFGIFLSLWWIFFERFGQNKITRLIERQKNATSSFFWTKEELEQRYFAQGLTHFEKVGVIFEQVSHEGFFKELDKGIERKFGLFQEILNVEEKAIRLSAEHIKQNMAELHRAQKNQKDLGRVYADLTEAINTFQQSIKDLNVRMSEQYGRLVSISGEKTAHLDRTIAALDEKIESLKRNFTAYEESMLQNQEKAFLGFKQALIQGMREFKDTYEEEKHIDGGIELMNQLKTDINALDNEASEVIARLSMDGKK